MTDEVPNLEVLLGRLSESIRNVIIPTVSNTFAVAELYSLASILRMAAEEVRELESQHLQEFVELRTLLETAGVDSGGEQEELRRRLCAAIAEQPDFRARTGVEAGLGKFRRADSTRGLAALLSPRRQPWKSVPVTGWRSLRQIQPQLSSELTRVLELKNVQAINYHWNIEGFAAETITAEIVDMSGRSTRVVLRAQWPERPLSRLLLPVQEQSILLNGLSMVTGLRVPRVLGVIPSSPGLGVNILVVEHVEGVIPTNWTPKGRQVMESVAEVGALKNYGTDLGCIQSLNWRLLNVPSFGTPGNPSKRYRNKVKVWVDVYRESILRSDPLMEEVICALDEHDATTDSEVLVHGDFRPGNVIYTASREGMRTCVIDWADATIGDWHEDLGVGLMWAHKDDQGRAMGLAAADELIEIVQNEVGRTVDPRKLINAQLLAAFRRCVGFHLLARSWIDHGGEIRMARAWLALSQDRRNLALLLGQR